MSAHDLSVPAAPRLRSLASVGWFGVMAVTWLAMILLAAVMLVWMIAADVLAALRSALHLGRAPSASRPAFRIANIF